MYVVHVQTYEYSWHVVMWKGDGESGWKPQHPIQVLNKLISGTKNNAS